MFLIGIILLVLGFVLAIHILWVLGIILTVVGAAVLLLGQTGHYTGRRLY